MHKQGNTFHVSASMVWFSSLFMGILASIPKILQRHITAGELMVDASIAFLFTLSVWYYNLSWLPKYSGEAVDRRFFSHRLVLSLLVGLILMAALVLLHQLIIPGYPLGSMLMMYEFRAVLINLTVYVFLFLLYQSFHAQQISIELERVKVAHVGARYELLRQQVNPHFLFNSLNTLKSMVDMQDPNASEFILKLSDFYRFTLERRVGDLIPLEEELDILEAYLFLLKARFEEGISVSVNLPADGALWAIPPFTLQLLAENCVKHNVISLDIPLRIRLYEQDGYIIMENNLQPKLKPEPSTHMGLENISQRYLHLNQGQVLVEKRPGIFSVKLPLIKWKY